MPRHSVEFTTDLTHIDVGKQGRAVVFEVWSDESRLGELTVSKGGPKWEPARGRRGSGGSLSWEGVAEAMEGENGRPR